MRYYLPLLGILWAGAFIQNIGNEVEKYSDKNVIEALQKDVPAILYQKEYDGKMSQTEMEQEASFLLAFYQGEMIKEVTGENYYSFYAFSERAGKHIVSEGEKINLNLVITYNEEENMTHVVWATPFLNEDF